MKCLISQGDKESQLRQQALQCFNACAFRIKWYFKRTMIIGKESRRKKDGEDGNSGELSSPESL
jgi:hypothetical protein